MGQEDTKVMNKFDIPIERVHKIKWLLLIDPSDGHLK
jgi:sporulation protein YlmC with PRC-barrel domain